MYIKTTDLGQSGLIENQTGGSSQNSQELRSRRNSHQLPIKPLLANY